MKAIPVEIANFSFEPPYAEQGAGEIKVANGWKAFWSTGDPPHEQGQGPCVVPEYKPALKATDPNRVVGGSASQCWFKRWRVMDAGVMQVVPAVPGEMYEFSVEASAWCSQKEDPRVSDGEMYMSLGVGPLGKDSPWEVGVLWSPWKPINAEWRTVYSPIAVAYNDHITLYIRAWNKWPLSHNDVYVDLAALAALEEEGGGGAGEPVDYDRIQSIVQATVRAQLDLTRLSA